MTTIDLDALREKVAYLGWWLEGQASPSRGRVKFAWYATEDQGSGLFQVTADTSALRLDRAERWSEAKRLGLAATRGKVFLNAWEHEGSYSLALPLEQKPIPTTEIRTAILGGLYRLYEAGFEEGDFAIDIEDIAVELRTSRKLVERAIKIYTTMA